MREIMGTTVKKHEIDMLHGSIWNKLPLFALPVAATAILEQLFHASDVAIVGNFTGDARTVAVAAVGANGPIIGLIVNLFIGIALGANVVIANAIGCRDDIMLYLISMGLDPKMSFKIMEAVRKGKVKKGGFSEGWEEAMREHKVPDWYIESLAKIGYLFPKAHAVAYVMMAFRIAWFKVHRPLAFYATFFTVRAKAFDAEYCCAGIDAVKRKIREIENNKDATAVEQSLMVTLEVCYEFYLRGFHFDTISIYDSQATAFKITENGLLPPFISVRGLGETAALDTVEKRKGKTFISVEEFAACCSKLSKTHIEQLKALGAFAGMADTSQITFF